MSIVRDIGVILVGVIGPVAIGVIGPPIARADHVNQHHPFRSHRTMSFQIGRSSWSSYNVI